MTSQNWRNSLLLTLASAGSVLLTLPCSSKANDTVPPTFQVQGIYDQPLWDYMLIRVKASEPVKNMAVTVVVSTQGSKSQTAPVSMAAILDATVFEGRFTPQKGWGDIQKMTVTASDLTGNVGTSNGSFETVRISVQDAKTEGDLKKLVEELNQLNRLTRGPMTLKEIKQYPEPVEMVKLAPDGTLRAVATKSSLKFYGSGGRVAKEIQLGNKFKVSTSERGEQYAVVRYPYLDVSSEAPLGPAPLVVYDGQGNKVGEMTMDGNSLAVPSDVRGKVVLRSLGDTLYILDVVTKTTVTTKYIPSMPSGEVLAEEFTRISGDGRRVAVMANYPHKWGEADVPSKSELFLCDIDGHVLWRRTVPQASLMQQLWVSRTGKYVNMWSVLFGPGGETGRDYKGRGDCVFSEDEAEMVLTSKEGLSFINTLTGEIRRVVQVKRSPTGQLIRNLNLSGQRILIGIEDIIRLPGRGAEMNPQVHLLTSTGDKVGSFLVPFLDLGANEIQLESSGRTVALTLDSRNYLFSVQ